MSEAPEWLEEGICVFAMEVTPGSADRLDEAVAILEDAGVPCHAVMKEAEQRGRQTYLQGEVLVPTNQHLRATSLLDLHLLNAEMEEEWKGHFETLSDDELMELEAEDLIAGFLDRADRLKRAYEDELLKRGLAELETGE
ncbi:MAG: hypothetical protein RL328_53 [Acidobacteriota bacterium]|jgi:hypothetical protein